MLWRGGPGTGTSPRMEGEMGNWIILEAHQDGGQFRELGMYYGERGVSHTAKLLVRLWPDGGVEVGQEHSPFQTDYATNLSQPEQGA